LFLIGGVGTTKTFTLLLIIQGLLHHYNKELHVDPLKQKTLFMAYIGKTSFNIDGTTIHSTLNIPLNCKHLPSLTFECLDILSKSILISNYWSLMKYPSLVIKYFLSYIIDLEPLIKQTAISLVI